MSRGLAVRIVDELFAMGAVTAGDLVVDPFAGIGSTGIECASRGVRFIGVELESRFVDLLRQNCALHRRDWEAMGRPQPVCVQGDSRRLREVLGPVLAECVIGSPPYATEQMGGGGAKREDKVLRAMMDGYGSTPGQLGAMRGGTVDAIVSSPPFSPPGMQPTGRGQGVRAEYTAGTRREASPESDYGGSPGQLGAMSMGAVDAVVSSPPYEGSLHASKNGIDWDKAVRETGQGGEHQAPGASVSAAYPASPENIGNGNGDTFWSAALEICRESYAILKPGGVAVWVVKSFVRKGQIVDFPGDWRRLCEHVGFELVQEVHASLVATETRAHLFDGERTTTRSKKSFFRRLAEKHGSPPIDFEVVLFLRRP